ncbi:hypothetical protein [Pedobacter nototheniae]|uniref:hypothetical protein n=1 Tax=Pedobacter nototheniae TaxID=2488994 RepID=UPI00103C4EF5|nr:hypothetical protein [Pedobacter nototheniae]
MSVYPILKVKTLHLPKIGAVTFDLSFPNNFLVVGLICPEIEPSIELEFNRQNLKPYELACQKFANADYEYSKSDIEAPKTRTFYFLDKVINATHTPSNFVVVIVSYLEFTNI